MGEATVTCPACNGRPKQPSARTEGGSVSCVHCNRTLTFNFMRDRDVRCFCTAAKEESCPKCLGAGVVPTLPEDKPAARARRREWTHPDDPSHRSGPWLSGRGPGIGVVAARIDEGIVRAIEPVVFTGQRAGIRLVNSVLHYVGTLRDVIEWTAFVYPGAPCYLHYGHAEGWPDMRNAERPSGVWLWKWVEPPGPNYIGKTQNDGVLLGPLVGDR